MRADDTRRAGSAYAVPRLGDTLAAHRDTLVLVFTLCTLAAAALRHPRSRRLASHLRRGLWPGIALLWGVLFVRVAIRLPAYMGFDGPDHLAYVRHLLERGALPLAADGPMMYHPPLFYALCAALVAPFGGAEGLETDSARIVLHALPLLSGLVVVTVAHRISRSILFDRKGPGPSRSTATELSSTCAKPTCAADSEYARCVSRSQRNFAASRWRSRETVGANYQYRSVGRHGTDTAIRHRKIRHRVCWTGADIRDWGALPASLRPVSVL